MTALIVISVIIAVFALILLIPVRFRVFLSYNDDGINSDMLLSYAFIKIKIPPDKPDEETEEEKVTETTPEKKSSLMKVLPKFIMHNLSELKDFLKAVLGHLLSKTVRVDKLYINSELGFDDAMNTGLIYGAVAGVVYNIAGLMDRGMKLKKHDITIKPDFNVPHIMAELEAIISTNIFNAIVIAVVALVRALPLYKKLKKMIGENDNGKSD